MKEQGHYRGSGDHSRMHPLGNYRAHASVVHTPGMEYHCITQAGMQWHDLSPLYPLLLQFKQFSCLSLLLECSGTILTDCKLLLSGSSSWDYRHVPSCPANFVFIVEKGFLHVGQAGLKLPTSGDPPSSVSQSAGIAFDVLIQLNANAEGEEMDRHFGRSRQVDHLTPEVEDHPDQHGKTLSLLKRQRKIARCGGERL
ncbi:Histone demethylase UTY [Plecturocebus cupreus]